MSMIRIAVIIELLGFILTTVSILLRVGVVKYWADKLKKNVVQKSEVLKRRRSNRDEMLFPGKLANGLPFFVPNNIDSLRQGCGDTVVIPLKMFTARLTLIGFKIQAFITRRRIRKNRKLLDNTARIDSATDKERALIEKLELALIELNKIANVIDTRSEPLRVNLWAGRIMWKLSLILIWTTSAFIISEFNLNLSIRITSWASRHNVITTSCISIGTLMIIIGLTLEAIYTP